jgi:hypothetical protein
VHQSLNKFKPLVGKLTCHVKAAEKAESDRDTIYARPHLHFGALMCGFIVWVKLEACPGTHVVESHINIVATNFIAIFGGDRVHLHFNGGGF